MCGEKESWSITWRRCRGIEYFPPEMGYEMMANVSTSQMVHLLLLFSFLENRKTYMILMKNCIIVGEATKGKRK